MAPSAAPESPSSPSSLENRENHLQPFFVLHKALPRKSERKVNKSGKTRRKIDLCPASPKSEEKSKDEQSEEYGNDHYNRLRSEAFDLFWSEIETSIKDVLRDININLFNDIHQWVQKSFSEIRSSGAPSVSEISRLCPMVNDTSCKQIFTGLVLTRNVEFVDDLLTFKELGVYLKTQGCHVANLSSQDFSVKSGIAGCLRSLLRQFVKVTLDVADIAILASWYCEQGNHDNPLIVIVDDMEQCDGPVLAEFILILSEWVIKIPIILIMGVSTTVDAPRSILPSDALQHLCPFKFILGTPAERLDAVIRSALLKPSSRFIVGYKVAVFLRNYFLEQDGTITSFIRALKILCVKHFSMEPLSFLLGNLLDGENQVCLREECLLLPEAMLNHAFDLPSCKRDRIYEPCGENLALGLSELKRFLRNWCSVFLCVYEAGKYDCIQLLDLFCEALDPDLCTLSFSMNRPVRAPHSGLPKGQLICQAIHKVRDLPGPQLYQLLKTWERHTEIITEIREKVMELQSTLKRGIDGKNLNGDLTETLKRPTSQRHSNMGNGKVAENEKAALLIECMVRNYLRPIESATFHEVLCFKDIDILKSALIGNPRTMIQDDLQKSLDYLHCSCCSKSRNILLPSMHDTAIMCTLAQEHGDLINLHDWYQSFKTTILHPGDKKKQKTKKSPFHKRGKDVNKSQDTTEASIQARFCRAVVELQITGLLRMPSKRRPDYVQRIAFGL